MPIYDYQCLPNNHRFEVRHGMSEDPVRECQFCGGPVRRVIHPVGIVFKGSGFYATDSRSSGGEKSDAGTSATETKSESKSEPAAEKKTESSSSTDAS